MRSDDAFRPGDLPDDEEIPAVAIPPRPWIAPLGLAAAVALGGLVFWQLTDARTRANSDRLEQVMRESPPLRLASTNEAQPDVFANAGRIDISAPMTGGGPSVGSAVVPPPPPPPADLDARLRSPSLVVDLSQPGAPQAPTDGMATKTGPAAASITAAVGATAGKANARSADEEFASKLGVGEQSTATRAQRMGNQSYIIAQGALISAVLETALNSDLPGFARATVSRDVYSFDGSMVLVPRGSRLIGQYRSGVALGQSRVFVIWTRLIRPDGVSVALSAPATDTLGRGGLSGSVDRHFLQRFGGSILLSLITAGAQLAQNDSDTQVIIASTTGAAGNAASTVLQSDLNIAPTVKVPQGAPIRVFVTQDLDFSVLQENENKPE